MSIWNRFAFAAFTAITLTAVTSVAGDTKVTNAALVIDGGQRFFRSKAGDLALGAYGKKKTPLGSPAYLEREKTIPAAAVAKVSVVTSKPITVDWSSVKESDIGGGLNYLNKGGGKASLTVGSAKSAHLVLVKFAIGTGDLKDLLNLHATDARSYMKNEGGDARIVGEVYVAMEAELASTITTAASVTATAGANGLEVEVKGGTKGTSTTKLSLPADTTFAYLLFKVNQWGGNKATSMEDDRQGLN